MHIITTCVVCDILSPHIICATCAINFMLHVLFVLYVLSTFDICHVLLELYYMSYVLLFTRHITCVL